MLYSNNSSTEQALVNVTEQIYKSIGKGKISLLVLLDLSKAFDSINHDLLLNKFVQLNIDSKLFEYISIFNIYLYCKLFNWIYIYIQLNIDIPWVAAQAVRWPGVPKVARSYLSQCSKSCDLQPALNSAIRGAQGVLPCVGWGVRPVNWIYRLWRHCP